MTNKELREKLMDKGFGAREYANGVFVWLASRNVDTLEVHMALIDEGEFKIRSARDPYRWNRTGVVVKIL